MSESNSNSFGPDNSSGPGAGVQRHGQDGLCGGHCAWCLQGHGA